jgi:ribulose-phosphate 3-epimerase
MSKPEIVPSLLSADFSRLAEEIEKVENAGCRRLHLDVMDGHFVPNISFGPVVIASIRKLTNLYFQAHLMIEHPERYIEAFGRAGSNAIIIHQEVGEGFRDTLREIKRQGMDAGVALKPATPVETIEDILPELDMVLVMTVEPGFGGQAFIPGTEDKVSHLRKLIDGGSLQTAIGVDGGVNDETIRDVVKAGATHLIAGNAVFRGDVEANIRRLNESIE